MLKQLIPLICLVLIHSRVTISSEAIRPEDLTSQSSIGLRTLSAHFTVATHEPPTQAEQHLVVAGEGGEHIHYGSDHHSAPAPESPQIISVEHPHRIQSEGHEYGSGTYNRGEPLGNENDSDKTAESSKVFDSPPTGQEENYQPMQVDTTDEEMAPVEPTDMESQSTNPITVEFQEPQQVVEQPYSSSSFEDQQMKDQSADGNTQTLQQDTVSVYENQAIAAVEVPPANPQEETVVQPDEQPDEPIAQQSYAEMEQQVSEVEHTGSHIDQHGEKQYESQTDQQSSTVEEFSIPSEQQSSTAEEFSIQSEQQSSTAEEFSIPSEQQSSTAEEFSIPSEQQSSAAEEFRGQPEHSEQQSSTAEEFSHETEHLKSNSGHTHIEISQQMSAPAENESEAEFPTVALSEDSQQTGEQEERYTAQEPVATNTGADVQASQQYTMEASQQSEGHSQHDTEQDEQPFANAQGSHQDVPSDQNFEQGSVDETHVEQNYESTYPYLNQPNQDSAPEFTIQTGGLTDSVVRYVTNQPGSISGYGATNDEFNYAYDPHMKSISNQLKPAKAESGPNLDAYIQPSGKYAAAKAEYGVPTLNRLSILDFNWSPADAYKAELIQQGRSADHYNKKFGLFSGQTYEYFLFQ